MTTNSSADLRYLCSERIIQFRRIPILLLLNVQQHLMAAVTVSHKDPHFNGSGYFC